jgi:uncharacterized OB-fold protein
VNVPSELQPQRPGIPLPRADVLSAPFWEGCRRQELLYQRCADCGHAVFNPAPICRWCISCDLTWERSKGLGIVYSWSEVCRPLAPSFSVPYVAAIIYLDEGYHMVSNIVGCTVDQVVVGMPVGVEFHDVGGGVLLPYFRPR